MNHCTLALMTLLGASLLPLALPAAASGDVRRDWMAGFDSGIEIRAVDDINHAIDRCPASGYCNVLVPGMLLVDTVVIARSGL